jgi:hypothetical protein
MTTETPTLPEGLPSQSAGTSKSKWLTEGLVIAAAPVAAYVLALAYISGYAGYFQIPVEFLSLNAGTLFVIGGKILAAAILIYFFLFLIFQFLPADSPILARILMLLPWATLVYVESLLFRFPWREWRLKLIILIVLAVELFVFPLMHKDKPSYAEKLREETRRFNAGRSLAVRMFQSERMTRISMFGFLLYFSLTISSDAGHFEAMWKKEFLIPASAPANVVVSTYGDYLVVAPFDKQTKEIERSFFLLKKGEDPKFVLEWQSVGPLHMKAPPASKP